MKTLKEEKLEAERRQEQAKLDADAAHDDAYDKVIAATGDEVGFVQMFEQAVRCSQTPPGLKGV